MPGISGTTLIREVRGIRKTLPVVLMSGYVEAWSRLTHALSCASRYPYAILQPAWRHPSDWRLCPDSIRAIDHEGDRSA